MRKVECSWIVDWFIDQDANPHCLSDEMELDGIFDLVDLARYLNQKLEEMRE